MKVINLNGFVMTKVTKLPEKESKKKANLIRR